jgi:hypothetical protein
MPAIKEMLAALHRGDRLRYSAGSRSINCFSGRVVELRVIGKTVSTVDDAAEVFHLLFSAVDVKEGESIADRPWWQAFSTDEDIEHDYLRCFVDWEIPVEIIPQKEPAYAPEP